MRYLITLSLRFVTGSILDEETALGDKTMNTLRHSVESLETDKERSHQMLNPILVSSFHVPSTDAEARAIYLGPYWGTRDEMGLSRYSPDDSVWEKDQEVVPEWVFPGNVIHFVTRPSIGESSSSVVYSIVDQPEWVIKYHSYCPSSDDPVDTNLRESYFLSLASGLVPEVTNRIKYFSGPKIADRVSRLKMADFDDPICPESDISVVTRFIISERMGGDLFGFVSRRRGPVPFNIVHGDLHMGNVAFRLNRPTELALIDFGRAAIRPEFDDSDPTDTELFCDWRYSPWESNGKGPRTTLRDDVFRAVLVLARMMHGTQHERAQENICDDRNKQDHEEMYMEFKLRTNFFDTELSIPGFRARYDFKLEKILPDALKPHSPTISTLLGESLRYIQNLEFLSIPEHQYILSRLEKIKHLH